MGKQVTEVDEYSFKETDYVTVKTSDGWIYRFQRPNEHRPYVFDMKQRPDGTRHHVRDTETPETVVEFMEDRYDAAQLHPEKKRSEGGWPD